MLTFRYTIDNKEETQKNGEIYIDFIKKDFRDRPVEKILNFYIVKEDDLCRPDKISKKMYGDQNSLEILLKTNEISNPFSIEEGEILYQFDRVSVEKSMTNNTAIAYKRDIREQYIKPDKGSKIDPNLLLFEKREDAAEKNKDLNLPPNFAKIGDLEVKIEGGKIIFGDDVTRNNQDCDKPLSKSQLLEKIIKNRI
jgi:hypothetical protein